MQAHSELLRRSTRPTSRLLLPATALARTKMPEPLFEASAAADISQPASPHTLPHAFATHLLQTG